MNPQWLASVHFIAERIAPEVLAEHPMEGVEITPRDGSVWETSVLPHEFHRLFAGDTFLWGGDLNVEPGMDDIRYFVGGNTRQFEIYREAGAHDARVRHHIGPQQTFFGRQAKRPYQLDHVFVDEATEQRVTGWEVESEVANGTDPLSDHAPILVTIDG